MAVRQLCSEAQKGDNRRRDSDHAKGRDHPSTGLLGRHVTQRLRAWCSDLLSGWDPALTLDSQVTPGELKQWGPVASPLLMCRRLLEDGTDGSIWKSCDTLSALAAVGPDGSTAHCTGRSGGHAPPCIRLPCALPDPVP